MWTCITSVALIAYVLLTKPKESAEFFENLAWREARERGMPMFGQYPPCYDICGATRTIFDILQQADLLHDHAVLLDTYSIVLCHEKHMQDSCKDLDILRRINELPPAPPAAEAIVDKYNPSANDLSREFLARAAGVLEEAIQKVQSDDRLSQNDKKRIQKMHETFYDVHYPAIKGC